jgi:predicted DNA-binding transcriptional regulator YafY
MKNVLERVLNLLAFLLTSQRPVTAEEIQQTVAGYDRDGGEAFRRMFERDKDLLRRLGVPLVLESVGSDSGYRIRPEEYQLPDPGLSDDERTALWLAAQVVRIGGGPSGSEAILKLGGAPTTTGVEPLAAHLGEEVDRLAVLFGAAADKRLVGFRYRDKSRTVEPHGMGHRRGHWYLVGVEGDEIRVYRVDRMEELEVTSGPGAFSSRRDVDVRAELDTQPWQAGGDEPVRVELSIEPEMAWWADRRLGRQPVATQALDDGGVRLTLDVTNVDAFIGWVLGFDHHAVVESPPEIRQQVIERIRGER